MLSPSSPPHRRSIRLKGYDYASEGGYFITLVTHARQPLFGEIIDGEMHLNSIGIIACDHMAENASPVCTNRKNGSTPPQCAHTLNCSRMNSSSCPTISTASFGSRISLGRIAIRPYHPYQAIRPYCKPRFIPPPLASVRSSAGTNPP